eukprot:gnl/MRDRNA2_/MRDRNA2_122057_c0_seq1.p1 gnl/MRDRNA2_/MRDRNA2_122057_c0~~gnl/MRDRNA2_/MRDRNA2_122057_c0_seq1.p1  ORF type:complete len:386 (+),score=56.34 gnl/MRDRNA2_/MRDRNA2_122057_c0_seq1:62-1219(+)
MVPPYPVRTQQAWGLMLLLVCKNTAIADTTEILESRLVAAGLHVVSKAPFPAVAIADDMLNRADIEVLKNHWFQHQNKDNPTDRKVRLTHPGNKDFPSDSVEAKSLKIERSVANFTGFPEDPKGETGSFLLLQRWACDEITKCRPNNFNSTSVHVDSNGVGFSRHLTTWIALNDAPSENPIAGAMVFPCLLPLDASDEAKSEREKFCNDEIRKNGYGNLIWDESHGGMRLVELHGRICRGEEEGLRVPVRAGRAIVFEVTTGPPLHDVHMLAAHAICEIDEGERWSMQKFLHLPLEMRGNASSQKQVAERWVSKWRITSDVINGGRRRLSKLEVLKSKVFPIVLCIGAIIFATQVWSKFFEAPDNEDEVIPASKLRGRIVDCKLE